MFSTEFVLLHCPELQKRSNIHNQLFQKLNIQDYGVTRNTDFCHSPTQPQLELELDLIMGRNPPPHPTPPPPGTFKALPGNLGS